MEAGERRTAEDRECNAYGGRQKAIEKDVTLLADFKGLLEPKGIR